MLYSWEPYNYAHGNNIGQNNDRQIHEHNAIHISSTSRPEKQCYFHRFVLLVEFDYHQLVVGQGHQKGLNSGHLLVFHSRLGCTFLTWRWCLLAVLQCGVLFQSVSLLLTSFVYKLTDVRTLKLVYLVSGNGYTALDSIRIYLT